MVSFIIIGKNEGQRLVNSIKSVKDFIFSEKIKSSEIIYVDSKSTDGSITAAFSAGADKVFEITGDCNAAIGRTVGAKEAKGDILFFLDGDMELIPGFWNSIINSEGNLIYPFVSGIEIDVLYDNNWNHVKTQNRRKFTKGEDSYELTTGGLFCITRELWNHVNGFDCRLKINEDLDFGVRCSKLGYKLCRKGYIWVKHHTRFYAGRSFSEQGIKYVSLFIRKNFFNLSMHKGMILSTYSYWILLCCIIACSAIPFYIPLIGYSATLGFRTLRLVKKSASKISLLHILSTRFMKDVCFWWYFITFWPHKFDLQYSRAQL